MFEVYIALQKDAQALPRSKDGYLNVNDIKENVPFLNGSIDISTITYNQLLNQKLNVMESKQLWLNLVERDFGKKAAEDYQKMIAQAGYEDLTAQQYYFNIHRVLIVLNIRIFVLNDFNDSVVLPDFSENQILLDLKRSTNEWSSYSTKGKALTADTVYAQYKAMLTLLTNGTIKNKHGQTPAQYAEYESTHPIGSGGLSIALYGTVAKHFQLIQQPVPIQPQSAITTATLEVMDMRALRRPWHRHPAVRGVVAMVLVGAAVCLGFGIATGNLESFKWLSHLTTKAIAVMVGSGVLAGMGTLLFGMYHHQCKDSKPLAHFTDCMRPMIKGVTPQTKQGPDLNGGVVSLSKRHISEARRNQLTSNDNLSQRNQASTVDNTLTAC